MLLLQSHGFLPYCHRSIGCCRLELSTTITCHRHLHFHTASYYYKYLDVTIVVASNVVARNRTLRSFTNDVHLFIFRAKFQGATRCVGSYTVHILVACHRLRFDWFIKVGSHKLLTRIKDSFGVKSLMFIVNNWSRSNAEVGRVLYLPLCPSFLQVDWVKHGRFPECRRCDRPSGSEMWVYWVPTTKRSEGERKGYKPIMDAATFTQGRSYKHLAFYLVR